MFNRVIVLSLVVAAALMTAASPHAAASAGQMEYLTFSGPVALPGAVLAAGTYQFESGPAGMDRRVVRVVTADRRRAVYMGLTIPASRPRGTWRTIVNFGEARPGDPAPLKSWYPERSIVGHQFTY